MNSLSLSLSSTSVIRARCGGGGGADSSYSADPQPPHSQLPPAVPPCAAESREMRQTSPFQRMSAAKHVNVTVNASAASSAPPPHELLKPPHNFSAVATGIYRSSFPAPENFPFLASLSLRTVVYLCIEDYPATHTQFLREIGAALYQYGLPTNKDPLDELPIDRVSLALTHLLDSSYHPVLVHCNKGKHRTGCLIGIYRRCHGWSVSAVFDEYRRFSFPKDRIVDQQFIELFDTQAVIGAVTQRSVPAVKHTSTRHTCEADTDDTVEATDHRVCADDDG